MSRECSVIINRLSGRYSEEKTDRVTNFLNELGMLPHLHLTQDLEEVTAIARRISTENRNPFIIVGGGDGTVNGVLNGLVPGAATLAVLPFGTANALTRELSIDSIEDALLKIARNRSRPASAGLIEKENIPKYFLLWAGIGFDGSVASGVRFREKKLLGKAAYVLSAVRQLISWESERMEVIADGKKYECHSIVVCNSSRYGGKFTMAPGASLFEPVFEAVCIQDTGRAGLLKAAARLLSGKGLRGTGIQVFKARELSVSGSKPVQVDGDYYCHAPMEIRIVPDFVRLIV